MATTSPDDMVAALVKIATSLQDLVTESRRANTILETMVDIAAQSLDLEIVEEQIPS